MALPMICELLEKCSNMKTREEKIAFLRSHNNNQVLKMILKSALDPTIKFALPPGAPPYKPCDYVDQHGRLYQEARKFYLFLTPECGGNANLHQIKRETIFIQLLEGIDPKEAELLCNVKDKKLPYKGITVNLVNEAFPGIIAVATTPEVNDEPKKKRGRPKKVK